MICDWLSAVVGWTRILYSVTCLVHLHNSGSGLSSGWLVSLCLNNQDKFLIDDEPDHSP
jgi:hypothetical protein